MSDSRDASSDRFLGVRLSAEEEGRLERYRAGRNYANRSEAVRGLLRESDEKRPGAVELPATRLRELEELVEDGYFTSVAAAVEHALEVLLAELVAHHREGLSELRRHARELRERSDRRRRADREGRELLRR